MTPSSYLMETDLLRARHFYQQVTWFLTLKKYLSLVEYGKKVSAFEEGVLQDKHAFQIETCISWLIRSFISSQ